MPTVTKTCDTYWARIFLSGPIEVAKQAIRRECQREGICVTIEPTTFLYTGGEEVGFVVGLNNYPKFPWPREQLERRATDLCDLLLEATCQDSAMLQFPDRTVWTTKRGE